MKGVGRRRQSNLQSIRVVAIDDCSSKVWRGGIAYLLTCLQPKSQIAKQGHYFSKLAPINAQQTWRNLTQAYGPLPHKPSSSRDCPITPHSLNWVSPNQSRDQFSICQTHFATPRHCQRSLLPSLSESRVGSQAGDGDAVDVQMGRLFRWTRGVKSESKEGDGEKLSCLILWFYSKIALLGLVRSPPCIIKASFLSTPSNLNLHPDESHFPATYTWFPSAAQPCIFRTSNRPCVTGLCTG